MKGLRAKASARIFFSFQNLFLLSFFYVCVFLGFRVWVGFITLFLFFLSFSLLIGVFWKTKTKDKSDTNEDDDDTHKRRRRVSKAKRALK